MKPLYQNPAVGDVSIRDAFWTPYLEKIRCVTLPYVFRKMDESGYIKNLIHVGEKQPVPFNSIKFGRDISLKFEYDKAFFPR